METHIASYYIRVVTGQRCYSVYVIFSVPKSIEHPQIRYKRRSIEEIISLRGTKGRYVPPPL